MVPGVNNVLTCALHSDASPFDEWEDGIELRKVGNYHTQILPASLRLSGNYVHVFFSKSPFFAPMSACDV